MKIYCRTWLVSHTKLLYWSGLMSESQQGPEICDVISRKRYWCRVESICLESSQRPQIAFNLVRYKRIKVFSAATSPFKTPLLDQIILAQIKNLVNKQDLDFMVQQCQSDVTFAQSLYGVSPGLLGRCISLTYARRRAVRNLAWNKTRNT